MSGHSKIEWTDATWNPVTGCTKTSPGCKFCYAERISKRLASQYGYPADDPFRITLHPDRLQEPLRWRRPRRVFAGSMTDLFHEGIPDNFLDRIFAVMALCPQHTFLLLTKRSEKMRSYLTDASRPFAVQKMMDGVIVDVASELVTKEEWRAVARYEGFYEVSNRGRVRKVGGSTKGRRNSEGILRPQATRGGYSSVCLSLGAQVRQVHINRLVLEAFVGPPQPHDAEARHRNGDPTDNRIENLRWGSKKDNMADALRHGTAGVWAKSQAKFTAEQVAEIRELRAKGLKLDNIAARYDTTCKHISAICLGRKYRSPVIPWPLSNVWLGVTTEDQQRAVERISIPLQTIAATRFVSVEPLLRPVDLSPWLSCRYHPTQPAGCVCGMCLDWVIVGGESGGPPERALVERVKVRTGHTLGPIHEYFPKPEALEWIRRLRDQCQAAGVPFFFKGWGGPTPKTGGRLLDGRTWDEAPVTNSAYLFQRATRQPSRGSR